MTYYEITVEVRKRDRLVPVYAGGAYTAQHHVGDDNILFLIENTNEKEFFAYCELLLENGYTLHSENSLSGNLFKTYAADERLLHIIYIKNEGKTRIISGLLDDRALIPTEQITNVAGARPCEVTQMIMDYYQPEPRKDGNFGMCYIVTLDDGSLIVYDGFACFSKLDLERFWGLLCEKGIRDEDGKIVISAWIITHEHHDHYWGMYRTLLDHGDEIRVKKLFVTVMPLSLIGGALKGLDGFVTTGRLDEVFEKTERFDIIRMHTGQKFNIRNAQIEVLYTLEDIFPEREKDFLTFNDTSTVTRITADGHTFMILGDAYQIASDVMCSIYGKDLKSDVSTVSHHGWWGCSKEAYNYISPKFFVFPHSRRWFDRFLKMKPDPENKNQQLYGLFYESTIHTFDMVDRDFERYLLADHYNKTITLKTLAVRNEERFNEQYGYPY
ncbi:MAG: hypothetical protein E7670_05965 [Ruminococcaceae bacterium]|nr:hypothetical protein [Oscillospiraceae bacterium]